MVQHSRTAHPLPPTAPNASVQPTSPTPFLSPANSTDTSPAFATVLQTPDGSEKDFDFSLDEPTQDAQVKDIGFRQPGEQIDTDLPECWGHRGASAAYPENTRMSFIEACKAGADGIETDIHITADNQLVMFHDPNLSRTTDGEGRIHEMPWKGVLENVRTLAKPHQPIPMFTEVLDILLDPKNPNVKLNIDCKVENDPIKLFGLIKAAIEAYEGWATKLAPRIILGLWHPKFLEPAREILPYLPRYAISMSLPQLRNFFFPHCHGFSVMYEVLASAAGARFRQECRDAGKWVCAWTVNGKEEMRQCARWGIKSVISDKPDLWREVKNEISSDRKNALKPTMATYILPYLSTKNYWFRYERLAHEETEYLEREAGKFDSVIVPPTTLRIAKPSDTL